MRPPRVRTIACLPDPAFPVKEVLNESRLYHVRCYPCKFRDESLRVSVVLDVMHGYSCPPLGRIYLGTENALCTLVNYWSDAESDARNSKCLEAANLGSRRKHHVDESTLLRGVPLLSSRWDTSNLRRPRMMRLVVERKDPTGELKAGQYHRYQ